MNELMFVENRGAGGRIQKTLLEFVESRLQDSNKKARLCTGVSFEQINNIFLTFKGLNDTKTVKYCKKWHWICKNQVHILLWNILKRIDNL